MDALDLLELLAWVPTDAAFGFVRQVLGPVLCRDPEEAERWLRILVTLQATGGNVSQPRRRLHLHHQTLRGYLKTMATETGIPLKDPTQSVRIATALRLLRVHRAEMPPVGVPRWA